MPQQTQTLSGHGAQAQRWDIRGGGAAEQSSTITIHSVPGAFSSVEISALLTSHMHAWLAALKHTSRYR